MVNLRHFVGAGLLFKVAAAINLTVSATGGNSSSPLIYGLMFEDINHSGDGGVYAELIMNRAFQGSPSFPTTLEPWDALGATVISLNNATTPLSSALPTSLHVEADSSSTNQTLGFSNPGYWGIEVKPQTYTGSFYVMGEYDGKFTVSLVSAASSTTLVSVDVVSESVNDAWTQHNFTLIPTTAASDTNNTFVVTFSQSGIGSQGGLDFNLISLFPPTYNNRPNGMRIDLMEAMKNLNPSFLRMPGGNNIEGLYAPYNWKWNDTIGPLKDRPGYQGTWSYENTNGLGLVEYLQWCDDLGMEPILAIWSGLYLDAEALAEDEMAPYVQDALNELEFITGDVSTTYGALRASLGYPDPWTINYVEIGNEDNLNDGLDSYVDYRFELFFHAIRAAYPNMTIIASTVLEELSNSAQDYHQYTRPDMFVTQFDWFDNYPLDHLTLAGEYACVQPNDGNILDGTDWSEPRSPWPFWIGSVAEAVYTIGVERNTNHMIGASYAPMLQNMNDYQWVPNLIAFDADTSATTLSTSYYVIQLLSGTRTTTVLPVTSDTNFNSTLGDSYWVAGYSDVTDKYIAKFAVYNTTDAADIPFAIDFPGSSKTASLTYLTAPDGYSINAFGEENVVKTTTQEISADSNGKFGFQLPQWSVAVLTA